jgi:Uma2 family endonuclease
MQEETYPLSPDLAIKIVTSFDTAQMLHDEVMMYLQSGTRQVWVVYLQYFPMSSVYIYRLSPDLDLHIRILTTNDDILDGGDVLPGFSVPFRAIFQRIKPSQ